MRTLFVMFLLGICSLSCQQQTAISITDIDPENLPENVLLVDVRTPEEFSNGHLPGAININWLDQNFKEEVGKLDTSKILYIYCQKGGRSAKAVQLLDSLGYKAVDLLGGYGALD